MPPAEKSETKRRDSIMTTELKTDRLVTDLKRIVHDSEDLLHATKDAVGERPRVRERLTDAVDAAKRTCRRLEVKAVESAKGRR
jgi:ElaB/YqjD/DUF883 family membrane-anchored ribosome-binding protein